MRVLALVATLAFVSPGPAAANTPCGDHRSERPTCEYAKVLFRDPVRIGNRVLLGPYVIEHDTERMAQGLPCTHIYAADDQRLPVVAFHCRHLDRKASPQPTVTLRRLPDPSIRMFQLLEYQFAGSAEGHGVPNVR